MSRYIGNYLRVPSSEPQQASAPGIWSISEQLAYQRANVWPPARDPYYNQTVLHLSGDVAGTRETNPVTQPRTFLSDASSNNFLLTPNGDVSARPFSPYASSYSNYFNGSSSYLSLSNTINLRPGTSDFTTEFWIYRAGSSGGNAGGATNIFGTSWSGGSPSGAWMIMLDSSFKLTFNIWNATIVQSLSTINIAQWYHIAITRSGTTFKLFVNGNLESVGTSSLDANNSAYSILIGLYNDPGNSNGYFNGYISNLRFVKGTALYTTSFTPSLTPLTAVPGTQLLICQSNRFIDTSSNAFTVTPNNSPVVAQNSPFVEYDTTSGSGYFDGTDDYVATPSNAAFGFSGTWTIECWFYVATTSGSRLWQISNEVDNCEVNSPSAGYVNYYNGSSSVNSSTAVVVPFSWTHLAAVCTANSTKVYVNGVLAITHSTSNTTARSINIGGSSNLDFLGYISNFRVVKGTAVYTGNFTPPTAPITSAGSTSAASYPSTTNVNTSFAESATSLLTLQTRAPANNQGILDSSPNRFEVTRTGNVAQGSFSPFSAGGWSNYFPGTARINIASSTAFSFGTGDFTVEGWIFTNSSSMNMFDARSAATATPWVLNVGTGSNTYWYDGTSYTSSIGITLGQWNHVAVTRVSGVLKIFVNGQQGYSANHNVNQDRSAGLVIGDVVQTGYNWVGYLSNLRIVKGQALYTGAFTPPTGVMSASSVGTSGTNVVTSITSPVSLLTAQSNRFVDNSTNNFALTLTNSPSIQPFSPFAPTQAYVASQLGGSAYFDASGDSIAITSSIVNPSGTEDFTLEFWFYHAMSSWPGGFSYYLNGTGSGTFGIYYNNVQNEIVVQQSGVTQIINTAVSNTPLNQWNHYALVRSSNSWAVWINGTRTNGPITNSTSFNAATGFSISPTNAYVSGFRIVKQPLYLTSQSTIPVPTAPPQAVNNTTTLLNFTGAGIVDSTGRNNLETVGNSAVQTSIINPFGSRTGLMYFNGSSYFYEPYTQLMNQLNGNFTIECWIYPTTSGVQQIFAGSLNSAGSTNWLFQITSANKLSFSWVNTTPTSFDATSTASISTNTWTYVAAVKNGGTITLYINGSADGTASPTGTYRNASFGFGIGRPGDYNGVYFTGYIDEFRMAYVARTITASPTGPFALA